MGRKIESVVVNLVVIAIVINAIIDYMNSGSGYRILVYLMNEIPFSEFIVRVIYKIFDFASEVPSISSSDTVNDFVKLLLSTLLLRPVAYIGYLMFCPIPYSAEATRTGMIERQGEYMKKVSFRLKSFAVNFVAIILVVIASNRIIELVYQNFIQKQSNIVQSFCYVIAICTAFFSYVLIFGSVAKISIGLSFLWAIFVKIFPEILKVFGTDALCLLFYISIYTNGFGRNAAGILMALIVWCAIADVAQAGVKNAIFGVYDK